MLRRIKRQFARKEAQPMIRVLIVEDEKPISNLIRMSLTKEGFQ